MMWRIDPIHFVRSLRCVFSRNLPVARAVAVAAACLVLPACASIVEGTTQTVQVTTDPSGASCALERGGQVIATVNPTPGSAHIDKSKQDLSVRCSKAGHFDESRTFGASFQGMTFGNILFGGLIGVGIDAASGAMHYYPGSVTVLLTPQAFPTLAARDAFFDARSRQLAAEAERARAAVRKECLPEAKAECSKNLAAVDAELQTQLALNDSRKLNAAIDPNAGQSVASAVPSPALRAQSSGAGVVPPSAGSSSPTTATAAPGAVAGEDAEDVVIYWREHDSVLRQAIVRTHPSMSTGFIIFTDFRILEGSWVDEKDRRFMLVARYTIGPDSGASRSQSVLPRNFRRTIVVDHKHREIVRMDDAQEVL